MHHINRKPKTNKESFWISFSQGEIAFFRDNSIVHLLCGYVYFQMCSQVFTDSDLGPCQPKPPQQPAAGSCSQTFPRPPRRRPGVLHLQSCGDLSSFTCAAIEPAQQRGIRRKVSSRVGSRAGSRTGSHLEPSERPHSLIGVFKETVLWEEARQRAAQQEAALS